MKNLSPYNNKFHLNEPETPNTESGARHFESGIPYKGLDDPI